MNRLTAEPGSSLPVEEIEFLNTSVQNGNTSERVETTLFQKLSPQKKFNVFETHAHPALILII